MSAYEISGLELFLPPHPGPKVPAPRRVTVAIIFCISQAVGVNQSSQKGSPIELYTRRPLLQSVIF